jgi:hypothetical protein
MEVNFSLRTLKLWYYRYKDSPFYILSIMIGIIILSIVLAWKLVYPQMINWFSINDEVATTRARIKTISDNISYLSSLSDNTLSDSLDVSVHALPIQKDFAGVLISLSQAARSTNVSLQDYSVSFGDLGSKVLALPDLGVVNLKVNVGGGVKGAKAFIDQVQESVPLAEVVGLAASDTSEMTIRFYYKPLGSLSASDTAPLPQLTEQKQALLTMLNTWWAKTKQGDDIQAPEDLGVQ